MTCFWRLVSPHVLLFVWDLGCDPSSLRKRWALTKSKLCHTLFGMSRFDETGCFIRENCELTLLFHSEQVLSLNILALVLSVFVWYVLCFYVCMFCLFDYSWGWQTFLPLNIHESVKYMYASWRMSNAVGMVRLPHTEQHVHCIAYL